MPQTESKSWLKRQGRVLLRRALAGLPRDIRFSIYRRMVECDPAPDPRLTLKIADTVEELEACFRLLHDAYVGEGFMKPHPSGMRVTPYHALPTTTTLCARWDGEVVGTVSLIREGVFGFPLQAAFDLTEVRKRPGQIAEVSALAVDRRFRATGGTILFPLMKFMYEYATTYFDTRHLVIAVNPNRIEMYESLLLFQRLAAAEVDAYDFANGAPAVGASLDLESAIAQFRYVYDGKVPSKNLYRYFVDTRLKNIQWPSRPLYTTNDPVMTAPMLDHFFNVRTNGFAEMEERRRVLLQSIYESPDYRAILPPPVQTPAAQPAGAAGAALRRHPRYSFKFPARVQAKQDAQHFPPQTGTIIEMSLNGFQAQVPHPLAKGLECRALISLGDGVASVAEARVVREIQSPTGHYYGFHVEHPDRVWQRCFEALQQGYTAADLKSAPVSVLT